MYKIIPRTIEGLPSGNKIREVSCIHPLMLDFLEQNKFEVYHEKQAFRVQHTNYIIIQRVDFLAFRGENILIVECKGAPLEKSQVFGAVLQVTMYMRLYRMLQLTPDPQLALEGFEPGLVRSGTLRGVLAIPDVALTEARCETFKKTYESLDKVGLVEPTLELWALMPASR